MKLTINSNQLADNPANFLRSAGYTYIRDRHSGQESFVRRLTGNFYPRLHCYVSEQGPSDPSDKHGINKHGASGQITFNLHLDQRPTRYEGQTAHAGEHDSPVVGEELSRLEAIVNNQTGDENFAEIVGEKPTKKKKWWPF